MNLLNYRAEKLLERAANAAHVNNQMMVITNENFFTEDNEHGFISKAEFLNHIETIIESDYAIKSLGAFLTQLSDGSSRMKVSRFPWTNPNTNEQMYFVDTDSKVSRRYSVICFPGLEKLIDGYSYNKFRCELDLDQLFAVAKKG